MGYTRVATKFGSKIGETRRCIREREDFAGGQSYAHPGTFWGRWEGRRFVIYSYGTVIAYWTEAGWLVTNVKYSRTTTGHQSQIRHALSGDYTSTDERLY